MLGNANHMYGKLPPLTLPIMLLNGSRGTIRQHSPCSEVTPRLGERARMRGKRRWWRGGGCLLHTLDTSFFLTTAKESYCSKRRVNEICRVLGWGASMHYADLVGLQTWQPTLRSGNPQACSGDWDVR